MIWGINKIFNWYIVKYGQEIYVEGSMYKLADENRHNF